MTDTTAPGMGHNAGPDVDFTQLRARVNEFGKSAVAWGEAGVNSEHDAEQMNDFIKGARDLMKTIDGARVAEKKPHDDAAAAVQEKYRPLLKAIDDAMKRGKALLTSFLTKKQAEEEAERRRVAEEAAKRAAEAAEAAKAAEEVGDMVGAAEAAAAAEEVEKQAAAAAKPTSTKVRSASGAGRATGLRTTRFAEIANLPLALAHYRDHPEIRETIIRLANADIRSAKGADVSIPGIIVKEKKGV